MKWCHVQCRSLKTHVIVDICLFLIQRVTFHEKSRGLVEFTFLLGSLFFSTKKTCLLVECANMEPETLRASVFSDCL